MATPAVTSALCLSFLSLRPQKQPAHLCREDKNGHQSDDEQKDAQAPSPAGRFLQHVLDLAGRSTGRRVRMRMGMKRNGKPPRQLADSFS
eukprot:998539-Pelagomonas_calceolata.AAC.1